MYVKSQTLPWILKPDREVTFHLIREHDLNTRDCSQTVISVCMPLSFILGSVAGEQKLATFALEMSGLILSYCHSYILNSRLTLFLNLLLSFTVRYL